MKKAFTIYVEDDCNLKTVQVGVAVQRESDGEIGVTFFSLSDGICENGEWLFKINGKADRVVAGEQQQAESEDV